MERVETGGLMSFNYEKDNLSKLSEEQRREIKDAYRKADERRKRDKRNKIIFWIIAAIVILGIIGFILLR